MNTVLKVTGIVIGCVFAVGTFVALVAPSPSPEMRTATAIERARADLERREAKAEAKAAAEARRAEAEAKAAAEASDCPASMRARDPHAPLEKIMAFCQAMKSVGLSTPEMTRMMDQLKVTLPKLEAERLARSGGSR